LYKLQQAKLLDLLRIAEFNMDFQQYCVSTVLFFSLSVSVQSQSISPSLKTSIKDDIKKDLMKQVSPVTIQPGSSMVLSPSGSKAIQNDNLLDFSKKYRKGSGGEEFEDKYKVSPHVTTYSSSTPVNKLPDGYVIPVFTGGHWVFANPTTRVDGLVYPSGLDLSGGGKKKMSPKAKAILEHVFGMKVED